MFSFLAFPAHIDFGAVCCVRSFGCYVLRFVFYSVCLVLLRIALYCFLFALLLCVLHSKCVCIVVFTAAVCGFIFAVDTVIMLLYAFNLDLMLLL